MTAVPTRRRAHRTLVVLLLTTLTGACGGGRPHLDMTLRRINLDLAFKDPTKAKTPTVVQIIDTEVPSAPVAAVVKNLAPAQPATGPLLPPLKLPPAEPPCRVAPPGAIAAEAATTTADKAPAPGVYQQHNTGTFSLMAGTLNLSGPYPPVSSVEIKNIATTESTDLGGKVTRTITYDVVEHGPTTTTVTTLQNTGAELDLVKTVSGNVVFTPTPAVTLMQFKDVAGTSWNSAGVDTSTGAAMVVQGSIVGRELVDVCGTMVDTYKISSSERQIDARTGYEYSTDANDPKIYNIATQLGAMIVRLHENSTTQFTANNIPVTATVNYTSTIDRTTPKGV